jgi:uncharacterized protein (TIGR02246 family)
LAVFAVAATVVVGQNYASNSGKAEQEIRKMMDATAVALLKHDVAALSDYYADGLTFTLADGRMINKTQFLDFAKNSKRETFNFSDLNIRAFGNTAVVNFTRTSTAIGNGGLKSNSQSRDTAMLVKNGKGWQFVALQVSNEQAKNQSGNGGDEQEIRQTLNTIADALAKNDVATLSNHYADNFTFVGSSGEVINKTQRLERAKNSKFQTFTYEDLNVRRMGDAAVVLARPTQTVKLENGETQNLQDRATLTMAKMNGRWQIVAIQTTPHNPSTGNQAETEKQLSEILTNWGGALGRGDWVTIEKILPADFMLMSPDGKVSVSRAEYLEVLKKHYPGESTITGKSGKTIITGTTAIQSGTYTAAPKTGGSAASYGYTATFVRRDGRWIPIAFNTRPMPQK